MNLVASLGKTVAVGAPAEQPAPEQSDAPSGKRPYRNLDVWPRTRAMLAAANQPLTARQVADALGVDQKNVHMAFGYHAEQVERIAGRPYRFRLRGAA